MHSPAPTCEPLPEAGTGTNNRHTCAAHEKPFYSLELMTTSCAFQLSYSSAVRPYFTSALPEFPPHPQIPARCKACAGAPHSAAGGTPGAEHISAPPRRCSRAQLHSQRRRQVRTRRSRTELKLQCFERCKTAPAARICASRSSRADAGRADSL